VLRCSSPYLNAIEKAWSKIRRHLRSTRAKTAEDLDKAVAEALGLITPDDANSWFKHVMPALLEL
jgi:hypothetical protein